MPIVKWTSDYGWFILFAVSTIGFSLVQDIIRPQYTGAHGIVIYLLGVLPNFFPAIGLPALFMILLPHFTPNESASVWLFEKKHITSIIISAGGLILWEFQQYFTPNGYYDWHDVLWTLIGSGFFILIRMDNTLKIGIRA